MMSCTKRLCPFIWNITVDSHYKQHSMMMSCTDETMSIHLKHHGRLTLQAAQRDDELHRRDYVHSPETSRSTHTTSNTACTRQPVKQQTDDMTYKALFTL